jgi:hypothetical protein
MFMGDFNFYRYAENRNRPGGNFKDSLVFNNITSHLGLVEIPIKGWSFTWSNMQLSPLLEQIDWFSPPLVDYSVPYDNGASFSQGHL